MTSVQLAGRLVRKDDLWDYVTAATLVVVVVGSVLAIGAVHPVSISVLLAGSGVAAALVVQRHGFGRALPLAALFGGLAAVSALQAVQLPARVVGWLAPETAAVFRDSLHALRQPGPASHALSLDSDATWIEVARHLTYAAVVILAARVAERFRRQALVLLLFAAALVVAAVTIGHGVLGSRELYGLYQPRYATPMWLSPLLNQNNLAGYLNLGVFCGITLLLSERRSLPLPLLSLGMAVLAALVVLSGSRGGFIALAVTALALGLIRRRTFVRLAQHGYWKPLLGTVVATLAIVAFSFRERTLSAYQETNTKLRLFGWVVDLIQAQPWVGVGRGAFETAFPPYRGASIAGGNNNVVFAHAECFPLQWAAEWGIPIALGCAVGLVGVLRPWSRSFAEGSLVGVAGGIAALTVQNLVDVAFEVPAVCIALITALVCVLPRRRGKTSLSRRLQPALTALAVLIGGLSVVVAASTWRRTTVTMSRDALLAALNATDFQRPAEREQFQTKLREGLLKRPGEPYLNVLGALAARNSGQPELALRWISHALELEPTRSDTYFVLGRLLSEQGHLAQGLEAMRRAIEIEPDVHKKIAKLAFKLTDQPELLVRLVPENQHGAEVVRELAKHLKGPARQRFLEAASLRHPNNSEILATRLDGILSGLELDPGSCLAEQRGACLAALNADLAALERARLAVGERALFEARVLALSGQEKAASAMLANKCSPTTEGLDCLRIAVRIAERGASIEDFQSRVQEYLRVACEERETCVPAEQMVGDLFVRRQDWPLALLHHERAAKSGGGPAAWRRYAEVARLAGAEGRATEAQRRAQRYQDD